jgi:hypothetical protein
MYLSQLKPGTVFSINRRGNYYRLLGKEEQLLDCKKKVIYMIETLQGFNVPIDEDLYVQEEKEFTPERWEAEKTLHALQSARSR